MQCRPEHLGERLRILYATEKSDGRTQFGEGDLQLRGSVLGGEVQGRRTGEHRVVDGRVVAGEFQIRVRDGGQAVTGGAVPSVSNRIRELAETVDGDRISELVHAGEVL